MTKGVYELHSVCVFGKAAEADVFTRPNGTPVRDFRATW
jgi:hypothetical protein